jgi:hypothetical protein
LRIWTVLLNTDCGAKEKRRQDPPMPLTGEANNREKKDKKNQDMTLFSPVPFAVRSFAVTW